MWKTVFDVHFLPQSANSRVHKLPKNLEATTKF
jgi:hypothetical protein